MKILFLSLFIPEISIVLLSKKYKGIFDSDIYINLWQKGTDEQQIFLEDSCEVIIWIIFNNINILNINDIKWYFKLLYDSLNNYYLFEIKVWFNLNKEYFGKYILKFKYIITKWNLNFNYIIKFV